MPKRIPTPPPADDEPRYLTVVHPYAISGTCNMELPKDRHDFARWVACCVDKDAFFAIFHKPSSRGMIIIEISRDYSHFDRILGEHRWSEFLQSPTAEDLGRVTQVFYCTYSTGRIVQKNGWKRIDVDEAWFKAWSPKNRQIKFPYPTTHFCDVPVEDQTNHALCRPLPGAIVTLPPVEIMAPQPVVGSPAWIQEKEGGSSPLLVATPSDPTPLGARGKAAPKAQAAAAMSIPTVKKTASTRQEPSTATRLPAVGGGPVVVKSSNVWKNTAKKPTSIPPVTNWDESLPVSRKNTPLPPPISPTTANNQSPAAPPGLPARKNAWGCGATSYPTLPPGIAVPSKTASSVAQGAPDRTANVSSTSWSSTGVSTSSPDSDSGPDPTPTTESDNPYAVRIHFSESMEEEFHGMGIRAMEDDEDLRELDAIAPGNWDGSTGTSEVNTSGWDDGPLDAADHFQQSQVSEKQILCKAHGIICKKGICAEYAKQVRLAKRAEEAEKRKDAIANKGKKGRSKARGVAKKNDENEPARKNTTQNNVHRGPGAPVKTNWRGAPRAIVTADAIEKREMIKDASDDGWGNSDLEVEPNVTAIVPTDAASDGSWNISENAHDPWAEPEEPVTKAHGPGGKPQGKKKPGQPAMPSNWADEAELAARNEDAFTTVSSRYRAKRDTSTLGWSAAASTAKSSTSGWGSAANADMPW